MSEVKMDTPVELWTPVDTRAECELPHPHGGFHKRRSLNHPAYKTMQDARAAASIKAGGARLGHREF